MNGELLVTWSLDRDGHAVCGDDYEEKGAAIHGVISNGRRYYPKDGEAFLRAMPNAYATTTFTGVKMTE